MEELKHIHPQLERAKQRKKLPHVKFDRRERQRSRKYQMTNKWMPGSVPAGEERARLAWLERRTMILKQLKITEIIFSAFYQAGNLTQLDKAIFPVFYRCLSKGCDIVNGPEMMRTFF